MRNAGGTDRIRRTKMVCPICKGDGKSCQTCNGTGNVTLICNFCGKVEDRCLCERKKK